MSNTSGIVVVGAGPAGGKAVEALRQEGYDGSLTLIGAEPELPYDRPPLSKGYLMGSSDRDSVFRKPGSWFAENDVDTVLSSPVAAIDRSAREVALEDGSRIGYQHLLLATGSRPRPLTVPGSSLPGVRYLRTLADSDALREALGQARRVAIIGGGWIGLEVAAAARIGGVEVTVLESAELPLLRVLGADVATIFADLHRKHGVDLRCGVSVRRILGDASVSGVELGDGSVVPADLVVVGVGITPNTELAGEAGLVVDNGIRVDEDLQSSDPAIWAAGDVASAYHPVLAKHIRVEHITNALHQGQAAARSMLGRGEPYRDLPFFYTDQYDLGMEYVGYVEPGGFDSVVVRGDVAGLRFLAYWLQEGRVLAGMHVNVWDATEKLRGLVGRIVDPGDLPGA